MPVVIDGIAVLALISIIVMGCIALSIPMIASAMFWTIRTTRVAASGLPVLGGTVVGLLDALLVVTRGVVQTQNTAMSVSAWYLGRYFGWFLSHALTPAYLLIHGWVVDLYSWVNLLYARHYALQAFVDGQVWPNVQGLWTWLNALYVKHYALDAFVTGEVWPNILSLWTWLNTAFVRLENAEGAILRDEARTASVIVPAILELQGFLPLLRQLAQFESSAGRAISGVGARTATLEQQGRVHGAQLEQLAPLAALAALSAVEIVQLVELAKDPCFCMTQGALNDLPRRVRALESMGS